MDTVVQATMMMMMMPQGTGNSREGLQLLAHFELEPAARP